MTNGPRLSARTVLPGGVTGPTYTPEDHGIGIVHIGLGAFHKAHQAAFTDTALETRGGDWRIAGISLRSPEPAADLGPQDARYSLIERGPEAPAARVIGALAEAHQLEAARDRIMTLLTAPATRIVSLTITEKGYGALPGGGGPDPAHPAIAHDMVHPARPVGAAGLILRALSLRQAAGTPPFTVLSCDNLPENGVLTRHVLAGLARRAYPDIAALVEQRLAVPSTMVDRITPRSTAATLELAQTLLGVRDAAAVETEPFSQWVLEDDFPTGRPDWGAGGALFTRDVRPFEHMKLRMLNGAHSLLAYAGFHAGHRYVRDAMAQPAMVALVDRHMAAAAATLGAGPGIDLDDYRASLIARFANPGIAHETFQIAMDGSQKMPQRVFQPAADAIETGQPIAPFAFATAAWMRHAVGPLAGEEAYELRDPRATEIARALRGVSAPAEVVAALSNLEGLVPARLADAAQWNAAVTRALAPMLRQGMAAAVTAEVSA